jgi:hypothetical protein
MTVCSPLNPVYRPSGPLGLYYAPGNRGLRPRQRIYQPSGLRTARCGSPAEIPAIWKKRTQRRKGAKTQRLWISRRDPAVWPMAIGTLGGTVKFRCDELPPNDASMRFSSRFQGILPMSPPPAGFGPCCLPFVNGRLSLHLPQFGPPGNSTHRRLSLPTKFP